jgi:hypothetical protein
MCRRGGARAPGGLHQRQQKSPANKKRAGTRRAAPTTARELVRQRTRALLTAKEPYKRTRAQQKQKIPTNAPESPAPIKQKQSLISAKEPQQRAKERYLRQRLRPPHLRRQRACREPVEHLEARPPPHARVLLGGLDHQALAILLDEMIVGELALAQREGVSRVLLQGSFAGLF